MPRVMPVVDAPLAPVVARATRAVARSVAIAAFFAAPGLAGANPQGASVAHGAASFATPDASTLNITTANGTVINWQSFGINPGEITRFLQSGASAAVLNRVVGGDPSAILGALASNGRVFLINPNGVVFGPDASVDTAGLVVSTLNMSDEDFLAGRLHFAGDGNSGAIVNQGQIHAHGSVMLIAPRIDNSGLIETADGGLLLAAGRAVTITSFEDPEIAYQLQAPQNEVVNLGQLVANGGAVSVFAGSIRHSGDIDATAVTVDDHGRVQLVASAAVTLDDASTISADGANGGDVLVRSTGAATTLDGATISARGNAGVGGDVRVLGDEVRVTGNTSIDAGGRDGGGQILVGGDWQGANAAVANARNTRVDTGTTLAADALQNGDGGKVVVWSDGTTQATGAITARGGADGGDGGRVEVSGKVALGFSAAVNTLAPHGKAGLLLLDPEDIVVATGGGSGLGDVDNAGDPSGGPGCDGVTCTIDPAAINAAGATVVLQATGDITIANAISIAAPGVGLNVEANDDITVNAGVTTNGGDIYLLANQANNGLPSGTGSVLINNLLNSNGGSVFIDAGDQIIMSGAGAINAGSGDIGMTVVPGGIIAGDIQLTNIATTGDVSIVNQNGNFGSSIVQSAAGGGTTGTRVLVELEFASGGTIGTLADPIRIGDGVQLESHAHNPLTVIAIKGLGDLTIGDGGSGVLKGVQTAGGGDIDIDVVGTLTLLTPGGGLSGTVQTGGGVGDDIKLVAGNGINVNDVIDADTEAVTLDAGSGAITQSASGGVTAGALKVLASTGIALDMGSNSIAQFTADNASSGNIALANSGGALTLDSNGTAFAVRNQAASGEIKIVNSADIDINDSVESNDGNVFLDSLGTISQLAAGVISAAVLDIANAAQVNLNTTTNQVIGLSGTGITGDVLLLNDSGGSALGINNIDSSGGTINITNSGGISVIGNVSAFSTLALTESSEDINGAGAESLLADNIQLTAGAGGIGNGAALHLSPSLSTLALASGGASSAGNIVLKFSGAFNTGKVSTLVTSGAGQQKVYVETSAGALTVDSVFGNAGDALELVAAANSINYSSGSLSGVSIDLSADSGIGAPGAASSLKTMTGFINAASVSGGSIAIDNTGSVSVTGLTSPGAGVIELNKYGGSGDVFIDGLVDAGSAGPVRLSTMGGTLHVNADVSAVSQIELSTTGGLADAVTIAPGVSVEATGIGSDAVVNASGDVFHDGSLVSQLGNVTLTAGGDYNMGSSAVARSVTGTLSVLASADVALGAVEAPVGAISVTAAGGAITDSNGAALNASGASVGLNASTGIGAVANALETQVAVFSAISSPSGDIALANATPLILGVDVTTGGGGNLLLTAAGGLVLTGRTISSAGNLVLGAPGGALGIDNSTIGASGTLSFAASTIDVLSGTSVNATTIATASSGTTRIDAVGGPAVAVTAANSATFNAGNFIVQGGSGAGASAKVDAASAVTVNASNVLIAGGVGVGSFASIDPVNVVVNASGNILLQAGAAIGAQAKIVADSLVTLNAGGNVILTGNQDAAVIDSVLGDVSILAGNAVNLVAGLGSLGDAVIVANGGAGNVLITSNSCANCVLLGFDPFANVVPDAGVFAGSLAVGSLVPPGEDSIVLGEKEILVLEELAGKIAAAADEGGGDDEDDEDRKICR